MRKSFAPSKPSFGPDLRVEELEPRQLMTAVTQAALDGAFAQMNTEQSQLLDVQSHVRTLEDGVSTLAKIVILDQTGAQSAQVQWTNAQTGLANATAEHQVIIVNMQTATQSTNALTTEQSGLEPQVPVIEQQITQVQTQLDALNNERNAVIASLATLEKQLQECEQKLPTLNDGISKGTADVSGKQTAVDTAASTLQKDQQALQTATTSLAQGQKTLQDSKTVLAADQKLLSDAKVVLATATKTYNDLVAKYGPVKSGKKYQEIQAAKSAMDAAAANVNALTLIVKNDQIAVDTAQKAVTSWTAARDAATTAVTADTAALANAQKALSDAQSALAALNAQRDQLLNQIALLQPQIDALRTQIANTDITIAADEAALADRNGVLQGVTLRLRDIGNALSSLGLLLDALKGQEADVLLRIGMLQSDIEAKHQANDAAMAQYVADQGLLSTNQQELLFAGEQVKKEAADVEAMQGLVTELIQLMVTEKADEAEAQALSLMPQYAPTRESYVTVRSSVVATLNGDWLELRTKNFDGAQSFTLGGTVITPEKGGRIITIPVWAAPEEIRYDVAKIQETIDHQMKTWHAPAPLASSSDLFLPSSLGTWTVETVSNGVVTTLPPAQLTQNIGGVNGLTGIAPDGTQGKELIGIEPQMQMTHPKDGMTQFTFENVPIGYTVEIVRVSGSITETAAKETIDASTFTMTFTDKQAQQLYRYIMRNPSGVTVEDHAYDTGATVSRSLTSVPSSVPAGTRDLPLAVAVNATDAPVDVSPSSDGTDPLAAHGLLVHPTAGKDVRLIFAPNGAGTAMIHEWLADLDARAGDGVTYTLVLRRADGTSQQLAVSQLGNGQKNGYIFMNETPLAMAKGESLELTLSSGTDDRTDAIAVQFDVAFLPDSCADLVDHPMSTVAGSLNGLLGTNIIDRINLFPADQLNLASSSDAIARAMMGAAYDTLSDGGKASMRSGIETAQAAVWTLYAEVVRQEFDWVLMKMNRVEMPPNDAPLNDGHQGTYLAQIPNLPSRATIRDVLWTHREDLYGGVYAQICKDSITVQNRAVADAKQAASQDQAVHDALAARGLLTAVNKSASERTLAEQLAIDQIYASAGQTPDRSGWTVAEFQTFDSAVAAKATQTASAGTSTDSTIASPEYIAITEAKGTLQPQSFEWKAGVQENIGKTFSFSIDQTMLLNGKVSVGGYQAALIILRAADGTVLSEVEVGAKTGIGMSDQKQLVQTLLPGTYTLTVVGKSNSSFVVPISADLTPTSLSSVKGMVELDGRQTGVSLSRFGTTSEGKPLDIKSDLTTWIVIHGRTDNAQSTKMKDLSSSLLESIGSNDQVITINWEDAAKDNTLGIGLDGANWISKVGEYIANQLKELGINDGHNIRLVGHSWGSFVAYEVATHFGKVQAIVSLDSAVDSTTLNSYPASQVNFDTVSENSWAFHSSAFGSDSRAVTANFAIDMQDFSSAPFPMTVGGLAVELWQTYEFKHAGAVYMFSELLKANAGGNANSLESRFSLSILLSGKGPNGTAAAGNYDGILQVKYEERVIQGESVLIPIIVNNNFS